MWGRSRKKKMNRYSLYKEGDKLMLGSMVYPN